MRASRGVTWFLAATITTALTGCGSPPPPPPSAAKDIEAAKMAIDSGRTNEKLGQIEMALASYQRAKEAISKGKEVAEGSELTQLEGMEEEARKQISALNIKKINLASQPEKPKPVAMANTPKSEDPEEKKKREADAAEAKRKAEAAKASANLDATFQKGVTVGKKEPKPGEDDEVASKTEKTATKKEGDKPGEEGDAAAEDEKNPKAKPIKPAKGPYPAITEQSLPLEVVKLQVKGKSALAYFQIYNKDEAGKRIMNVAVFFKNANGQECITPQSVGVFPFNGFKADVAAPINQQIDGVTAGNTQVTGLDGLQLVAVGESDKASDVKSVGVIVVYSDGTKVTGTGPAGGVDLGNNAGPIKGLKTK